MGGGERGNVHVLVLDDVRQPDFLRLRVELARLTPDEGVSARNQSGGSEKRSVHEREEKGDEPEVGSDRTMDGMANVLKRTTIVRPVLAETKKQSKKRRDAPRSSTHGACRSGRSGRAGLPASWCRS